MASIGDERLSPAAQLFNAPSFNCYVIAIMGCKTSINPQVIKRGLCQTLLKHPRFTSKLVKKGRKTRWTQTTVDLDNHVIVPEIDSKIEFPDRFIEDYISNVTKTPLDLSKPLWELHLLNIKTSDAEAVAIFRIHHSMGDGASLMSLLLAATRKTSDPNALPTVPTQKRASSHHRSSSFWWLFLAVWWWLGLIWHTVVDMVLFVLTILFIKDTHTPLKGAPGVELNTKRFVYRTVSMDDIKLVKKEMKTTVNDVLLGVTQAGLTRYLNREYGQARADENGGAAEQSPISVLKNIRLRAAILVNIRPVAGIQDLADMMAEKSKAIWGNWMGYIMLPFSIALNEDPLDDVRQAKATIDRKKHSLEAICSYACAKLVLNLFGVKVTAAITRRVLFNTTLAFSNVLGPVEEVSFYGHPVAYIAPSVYGHPHALTIHFQSYANKMTISLSVDPSVIPDPYLLCDDLEESLKLILDAVQKKHIDHVI
ncbi:wax ester synthase/diacylglycerol acyltransferase 11 isoform X2 [Gastrolobium bilobum]|uniref:wax ester synthase/diacylglycerol acyltransferase 11 isoform X2 n=1 Tax=Gastrolobium bilobum TaxID=150636 RepID=UPI002AB12E82|nr:wax ester synthase/diacylglycerol acyltransferase 11 isoform X2 [Gastrolobium bilobum]